MKTKILKGFFDLARKSGIGAELVRVVPDLAVTQGGCAPEPGLVYVETCPLYPGSCFGFICSSGYVEPARLTPLKNIRANRERVRLWAAAKRQGIARSEMWYNIYKGARHD